MEPVVLALENKYRGKMDFVITDVNTQEGSLLAQQYDIYYIPVYFILDGNGNTVNRIEYSAIQDRPREKLEAFINKALSSAKG